jgi:CDP-diacylglycerol--serine O-phosphatidyltransferase
MKDMKGIFPGFFTMGNLLCGFLSILRSLDGDVIQAAWLVILAGLFDALDGGIARFSRSASQFGTELDSFADLVSFGVAPAVLLYSLEIPYLGEWGWILGFVFVLCGAFRLARFNLRSQTEQTLYHIGLPIPMAGITIIGYVLFSHEIWSELRYMEILIAMILIFSGLMVSGFTYDTFPRFSLNARKNKIKLLCIFVAIIAVLVKPKIMIFPVALVYVLSGMVREIYNFTQNKKKNKLTQSLQKESREDVKLSNYEK